MANELVIGNVVLRNKQTVLVGDEIQLGIVIPTMKSRSREMSRDKGNRIQDCFNPRHRGSNR